MPLMFGDPGPVASDFLQPLIQNMRSGNTVNLFVVEFRTPLSGKNAAEGLMIALEKLPDKAQNLGRSKSSYLWRRMWRRISAARVNE
jgi:dTDP-4-dehydrorhamnose reductase